MMINLVIYKMIAVMKKLKVIVVKFHHVNLVVCYVVLAVFQIYVNIDHLKQANASKFQDDYGTAR